MDDRFSVVVSAGSLRVVGDREVRFTHRWTSEGVSVTADFTGGHLLDIVDSVAEIPRALRSGAPVRRIG